MTAGARSLARSLLYDHWPGRVLGRRLRPRAAILVYHRVARANFDPHSLAVTPEHFEEQLRAVARAYTVLNLDAVLDAQAYPDKSVTVTFDDGYADTLSSAAPLSERLGVPMTVFVTTQPVQDQEPFWWDELAARVLGRSDAPIRLDLAGLGTFTFTDRISAHNQLHARLRHLPVHRRDSAMASIRSAPGFECQVELPRPLTVTELQELAALPHVRVEAHTRTHPTLGALSAIDQTRELTASKIALESWLDRPVTLLAYPFGQPDDVSRETRRLTMRAGYRAAFTTRAVPTVRTASRWALPRLSVHDCPAPALLTRLRRLFGES